MLASLFELRLFQDDPRLMLRASAGLLRQQGRYLGYAFVPLLWVSLPLSLLLAHLQAYYGYDALRPGQSASVIVHARENDVASVEAPMLALQAPSGLRVETPCVWVPSRREGAWRIAVEHEGDYDLRVTWTASSPRAAQGPPSASAPHSATTAPMTKRVRVTDAIVALAPVRSARSLVDEWLNPAEPPLPADAPIDAITVTYPERTIDFLSLSLPWLVVFLLLTTVFMLLGRSIFHVVM